MFFIQHTKPKFKLLECSDQCALLTHTYAFWPKKTYAYFRIHAEIQTQALLCPWALHTLTICILYVRTKQHRPPGCALQATASWHSSSWYMYRYTISTQFENHTGWSRLQSLGNIWPFQRQKTLACMFFLNLCAAYAPRASQRWLSCCLCIRSCQRRCVVFSGIGHCSSCI